MPNASLMNAVVSDGDRYLPARAVWERYGVTNMSIYRWVANKDMGFPQPFYIGDLDIGGLKTCAPGRRAVRPSARLSARRDAVRKRPRAPKRNPARREPHGGEAFCSDSSKSDLTHVAPVGKPALQPLWSAK
jgi:predicted DNA-binding transcriptional regulator AlpA